MALDGGHQDRYNILRFLGNFELNLEVDAIDNASRKNIEDCIRKAINSCPPLLVAYFQGHATIYDNILRYITSDDDDELLEYLTAEELVGLFSKLTTQTKTVVITDFCHSGNMYGLEFFLKEEQDGTVAWHQTDEWNKEQRTAIASPMLHIAGSLREQKVYETGRSGGYVTEGLAGVDVKSMTLPQVLRHLRRHVDYHIEAVNRRLRGGFSAKQTPQIYSSYKWPLDDPRILSTIGLIDTSIISD
ncbi:unnamed protein product [Rhizoctonia solani]|uniref:Peptidase C14 caspase domain-containing protein n=1 Tax=Rhizoctonia solani TaxID=456999 RepID=A0A8H3BK42_9AGAM|nr:unnamed protein product [Rhizoctonia solani]